MRNIDIKSEIDRTVKFIQEQLAKSGFGKVVVGLSGGIDSALTCALSVKAIGKGNVYAVLMPYRTSNPKSTSDAVEVAKSLDVQYEIIEITAMVDTYFDKFQPDADFLRRGNRMARERMCILYDLSAKYNALVAGTGNLSELMIGYCTQYGDSACAFETIGHLYKTELFKIAEYMGLPECVIKKKPTADLWLNQTDEDEIGITYVKLDEILYNLYELKRSRKELLEDGFEKNDVEKVIQMHAKSEFKRVMPAILTRD